MQHALRPYATAGIALVGASIIAVTPLAVRLPEVQMRPVQLVDAWSDLFTDTTANLENIAGGADLSAISGVFSELFTNPLGVISALTSLDPTVTTTAGLPLTIGVELPPGLELAIAQFAAEGATLGAINDVVGQLSSDPSNALSTLFEAPATIANAYLNGADNVSLLGGIIDIPAFNGILAPEQSLTVDLNLTDLVNALGLGSLNLGDLDLTALLGQVGLGDLTIGTLITDLGLSNDGLGTLLADGGQGITTLGGLTGLLGLGGLTEGLGTALGDAGLLTGVLDTPVIEDALNTISLGTLLGDSTTSITTELNSVDLGTLVGDLGLTDVPLDLGSLGDLTSLNLGDLLGDLGLGDLATINVDTFGGLITELVDTVPEQILAGL
jgi:hypothetical protein